MNMNNVDDEYVVPRPPTIHRRKKSVSRISSSGSCHHETRFSSSLFSLPTDEDFDMDMMSPENSGSLFFNDDNDGSSNSSMMMDLSSSSSCAHLPLHGDHGLDFDRVSPTSVMDVLYGHHQKNHHYHHPSGLPSVPNLASSFSSDESELSSSSSSMFTSPERKCQKIRKWSSFHEHGRDWGTSEACDPSVTQDLLHLLNMMEEEV